MILSIYNSILLIRALISISTTSLQPSLWNIRTSKLIPARGTMHSNIPDCNITADIRARADQVPNDRVEFGACGAVEVLYYNVGDGERGRVLVAER